MDRIVLICEVVIKNKIVLLSIQITLLINFINMFCFSYEAQLSSSSLSQEYTKVLHYFPMIRGTDLRNILYSL